MPSRVTRSSLPSVTVHCPFWVQFALFCSIFKIQISTRKSCFVFFIFFLLSSFDSPFCVCVCVRETTVILGGRCVLSSSVPLFLRVYNPLSWALLCTACSSCPYRVELTNQKGASPAPATRVWFQVSDCGRTSCAQAQSKSKAKSKSQPSVHRGNA